MVEQYPDIIQITKVGESVYDDSTQELLPGETTTTELKCRAEVAGSNAIIKTVDGETVNASWVIYIPLPVDNYSVFQQILGAKVTMNLPSGQVSDTVKQCSVGQLNARIWL